MSHKFLAGAGLLVLAGWGVSGLAVAGSDIKQVDLTLRILVDGPPPCSVKGSAVEENAADNSLFAVGENNWTPFNVNTQPQLKAVPVKQSGVQLTPSEFNATMTMVVDYQ